MSLPLLEAVTLTLVVGAAVATAALRDTLAVIIVFAGYSLGMAVLWVVLQAPDVGLTEAAVGAGVMTVLFLATIANTTRERHGDALFARVDWSTALPVVGLVGMMGLTLPALPAVGDPTAPAFGGVTDHYLTNAYAETGVSNVVTAILVAYRGFDTFGEAVVVVAAGIGVLVALDREVLG